MRSPSVSVRVTPVCSATMPTIGTDSQVASKTSKMPPSTSTPSASRASESVSRASDLVDAGLHGGERLGVGEVAFDVEQRRLATTVADVRIELVEADDEVGVGGEEVLDVELGRNLHGEHGSDGGDDGGERQHDEGSGGEAGHQRADRAGELRRRRRRRADRPPARPAFLRPLHGEGHDQHGDGRDHAEDDAEPGEDEDQQQHRGHGHRGGAGAAQRAAGWSSAGRRRVAGTRALDVGDHQRRHHAEQDVGATPGRWRRRCRTG